MLATHITTSNRQPSGKHAQYVSQSTLINWTDLLPCVLLVLCQHPATVLRWPYSWYVVMCAVGLSFLELRGNIDVFFICSWQLEDIAIYSVILYISKLCTFFLTFWQCTFTQACTVFLYRLTRTGSYTFYM